MMLQTKSLKPPPTSLIETLKAAFASAEAEGAGPFRLHPLESQIEELRAAEPLAPLVGLMRAVGSLADANIFEVVREPCLLVQS